MVDDEKNFFVHKEICILQNFSNTSSETRNVSTKCNVSMYCEPILINARAKKHPSGNMDIKIGLEA
jgi:hypothetical protein